MHGTSVGSLSVSYQLQNVPISKQVFSLAGDQGSVWKKKAVDITNTGGAFNILLNATVGSSYSGDIAVDDVKLDQNSCSTASSNNNSTFDCGDSNHTKVPMSYRCNFKYDCPNDLDEVQCGNCDFEQSLCRWVDVSAGSQKWQKGSNVTTTSTMGRGPAFDHTRGNSQGHYIYIDGAYGTFSTLAEIISPPLQPSSSTCQMQFYYHMLGSGIGYLRVAITVNNIDTIIWEQKKGQANRWIQATADIGRISRPFTIKFQGHRSFSARGDIAVDDVQLINCNFPPVQPSCSSTQHQCARKSCVKIVNLCDFNDDCGDNSDESLSLCRSYPVRCNFESSLCAWVQDNTDDFDWIRATDKTASIGTGPTRDHTTGTASGYYLYIEASSPRRPGDKARIISPTFKAITPSKSTCTLRMFYHMYGAQIGSLNVYTRSSVLGSLKPIWKRSGNIGDHYERADIQIFENQPFQVVIEGVVGNGYLGDIAIDDISFTPGCVLANTQIPTGSPAPPTTPNPCGANFFKCTNGACIPMSQVCDFTPQCTDFSDELNCGSCTFEHGQCGWTDVSSGKYNFHIFNGSTPGTGGPTVDHTTNTAAGHYMLVEAANGQFFSRALLSTPVLASTGPSCQIQFYYHMFGVNSGNMRVLVQNANKTTDKTYLWSKTGNQGNKWNMATVDIGPLPAGYKVQFEAFPSRGFSVGVPQSDMAIDDVTFINCGINNIDRNTTVNCTFETGFCNFRQLRSDDFDWTRTNISSPTFGTGPDRDHTTGTGYYVYIETSSPRHKGETAVISSGIQQPSPTGGQCLSFWYHMFGAHVNTLNVYVRTVSGNKTLVWTRSNTQGNLWRNGLRTIKSSSQYELLFEGVVGYSWQGDIALDDVTLISGTCPPPQSCDFEADLCDWTQSTNDQFDWLRHRNGTASRGTGPMFDHTTRSSKGIILFYTVCEIGLVSV